MDEQVARWDPEVADLLEKFVCVRLVQGWGLDLSLFQFDGELTWAVFFLNGDKTIYGRYGSRSSHDADRDVSMEGFRHALTGALELHQNYPANKAALAGKKGPPPRWPTPEKIPELPGKVVIADGTRANCIHCHSIPPGEILSLRKAGEPVPDKVLWPYPMPDALGLTLDKKERAMVQQIKPASVAARAGFQPGDKILKLQGQPIISIADVQWVLHNAAEPGQVQAEVKRGNKTELITLPLAKGWRRAEDFAWRTPTWNFRFSIAGFKCGPVPPTQKANLKLGDNTLALLIEAMSPGFVKDRNQAAVKIGLQKGDIIIAVDGQKTPLRECDFLAYLLQEKRPGDTVRLTVLRAGKPRDFNLPLP